MNSKNGHQHFPDILIPSDEDCVALADAVESRFLDLCGAYQKIKGKKLIPPPTLRVDLLRWRQMRVRHLSGDLRHSVAELKSTRAAAQWTCDVNAEMRNQVKAAVPWKS